MSRNLYLSAFAALAMTLSASAVNRNVEILPPPQIGAEDVVEYRDAMLEAVPKTLDTAHLLSVGKKSTKAVLKAGATDPSEFTMAIDLKAGEVWIMACNSKDEHVIIPDEIEYEGARYPVSVINTSAFGGVQTLKELTFGANIRLIKTQAFMACMSLKKVNLNEGLVEIEAQAFSTFMTGITSLELPSTVEILGERCFSGTKLSGEFIINKNLREIGGGAFAGKAITGFYINEDGNDYFSSIDGALFSKDGESLVVYPPALVEPTLTLPATVKKLAPYAFAYSTTLKEINLSDEVTEIGEFAFRGCNLTSFKVGKNVTSIGEGVVSENKQLTTITVDEGNTTFTANDGFLIDNVKKILLAVPYTTTTISVPAGVETVGKYLGYNNKNITALSAPESVKLIGEYAFYSCESMASIDLKGVETIGMSSFQNVKQTQKVEFPSTLKNIGRMSFASTEIPEFVLPQGIETIGDQAFTNSGIVKINIPGTVKELGSSLFYQAGNLSELTLGEGLEYIPELMCYGCTKLYFLDFPSTIKEVRANAFSFSWLQIADLPEGCVKVGNAAFQLAPLHYIDMPNSLEEIGDLGFSITNAEYVKCGSGLKRIGANGLQSQKKAAYITLNEGLESIGYRGLYGEENIKEITIPSTVTHIGDSAFIITPLTRLVNLSKTPQPVKTMITGNPYNPYPQVKPIYDTCTLVVPNGCADAYRDADIWKLYEKIEELPGSGVEEAIEGKDGIEIVKIYGLDGVIRETLGKGVNICIFSDGTVTKVFSKD
ncbi:MAG: leucine-rich repeat domain-containing protein [Muribaculaceae bacterium]|nr:leucine-rich repeat domain-containing protein [Muribaculaceae bacterium]